MFLRVAAQHLAQGQADNNHRNACAERRRMPAVRHERPGDDGGQYARKADTCGAEPQRERPPAPEPTRDDRRQGQPSGEVEAYGHHQDDEEEGGECGRLRQGHETQTGHHYPHAAHRPGAEAIQQPALRRTKDAREQLRAGERAGYSESAPSELVLDAQKVLAKGETERRAGQGMEEHCSRHDPPAIEHFALRWGYVRGHLFVIAVAESGRLS